MVLSSLHMHMLQPPPQIINCQNRQEMRRLAITQHSLCLPPQVQVCFSVFVHVHMCTCISLYCFFLFVCCLVTICGCAKSACARVKRLRHIRQEANITTITPSGNYANGIVTQKRQQDFLIALPVHDNTVESSIEQACCRHVGPYMFFFNHRLRLL